MKYVISESRLERAMEKVFNQYINVDELKFYHPVEETEDGDEYEDTNRAIFYVDDVEYDENEIFRYYECEYFNEDVRVIRERCPIITLDSRISDTLNDLFDDLWKEPFRKWINESFDLRAKTIE
jgi:hypothetical protein